MLHRALSAHSNRHQSSSRCTQSCHTMARQCHHQSLQPWYYAMLHSTPSAHSNRCQSGLPPCSITHYGMLAPPSIPVTTASCHAALHPEHLQQPLPEWSTTVPCHATDTMARWRHRQSLSTLYHAMLHRDLGIHSNCHQSGYHTTPATQHCDMAAPATINPRRHGITLRCTAPWALTAASARLAAIVISGCCCIQERLVLWLQVGRQADYPVGSAR